MDVGAGGLTLEQQDQLWDMWRGAESIREIERSLGVTSPRIRRFLRQTGGIRPQPRRRRDGHLSAGEREEISRGLAAGSSGREIAAHLGRSPSTVAREITRNGGREAYRAMEADAAAFDRAARPKPGKLATNPVLGEQVAALLTEDWSPQQIAATLLLQHPDEPRARVSHETIYRDLYTPSRQVFAADTFHRLRRSLTWDRGREMASHATITAALSMPVFFCDPHHPWQRGTNENTNRLLRQYLHKQADLSALTQQDVDLIAAKLNHRPRRVLGWATPVTAFGPVETNRRQAG